MADLFKKSIATDEDMEKIKFYTRRELNPEEIYVFNVTLCNNDIDRDFEKFSVPTLYEMANLFLGKTGIFDHSMKTSDQKARIFHTFVEKVSGRKTVDGEDFYCLKAKAYMMNNDENKALIDEIDAGIKKEVSVSLSVEKAICSICGTDKRHAHCEHILGKIYGKKQCFSVLENALDAYEFSFVAVPAQREAGITKSFELKEDANLSDVIKSIERCENDMTISKHQAQEISAYIQDLKSVAELGEEYKKQISKEIIAEFKTAFPKVDCSLVASITSVMTTKELMGIRDGMKKSSKSLKPQLSQTNEIINNNSEFII